jgi:GNAT superfamily N-acetyltransferase
METFSIRRAERSDTDTIARHRAIMFQEMGQLQSSRFEELRTSRKVDRAEIESGEYVSGLASLSDSPVVLAGAGVQRRRVPPHSRATRSGDVAVAEGRHAIVLNVFTEPAWRGRGVATLLMRAIFEWARNEQLDRLLLPASEDGRALYQRLGFVATNEMRFAEDLSSRPNER